MSKRSVSITLLSALAVAGCAVVGVSPRVVAPPPPPAPPPITIRADTAIHPPPPMPRTTGDLAADIGSVVHAPPLQRTTWGIEVYDPASDSVLVAVNAHKHFVPASNTKLLTTTTAMAKLGPDFRYHTPVLALGLSHGAARALLVRGRGDPTLSGHFHPAGELAPLDSIADSLYVAGLRRVRGPVIIDVSYFDSTIVNPSWEVGDLQWYYAAPVTAFGVSEGTIPVEINAWTSPGHMAGLRYLGPPHLATVRGGLTVLPQDSDSNWDVKRLPGDTLVFHGSIAMREHPDTAWISALDPPEYAGRALVAALRHRGIRVDGRVRVLYDSSAVADEVRRVGPATLLTTWSSPPLKLILQKLLEPSDNWIAEHLLKTLGAEAKGQGSWRTGIQVVRAFLADDVGIDSLAVHLRDGSGLSAQNLVTPHALVQLLAYVQASPWADDYMAALAAPGEPESTLQHRLLQFQGRLQAKTGTIANVNSLSGYFTTDSGRRLIFSILSNGSGLPSPDVRQAANDVIRLMAVEGGTTR